MCPSAERGVEDGLLVDPKRLLDNVLGVQLYTQKGCILKQVAARVAVALGELVGELLNAKSEPS